MVKKMNVRQVIIFTVVFILGVLIIAGEGIYRKAITKESVNLAIELQGNTAKPVNYDIASQGFPKRLAQPGRISFATGHGAAGVINKGNEPVSVQVKVRDIPGNTQLISNDSSFDVSTGKFKKAIEPGKSLDISFILDIPRSELNKKIISDGKIEFTDYVSGKIIATLPVKIVNSAIS